MADEHSSPTQRRFIDGVYNFCDSWCERCRLQSRCRVYHDRQNWEAQARGEPPPFPEDDEPGDDAEPTPEWRAFLEEANREPTAAEIEAITAEEARLDDILDRDALVIGAKEYTEIVLGLSAGLDPLFEPAGDALIEAAMDTIGRLGVAVGVKVWRASRARLRAQREEEHDEDGFSMEDANGTAKLVRLLIRESREAWHVLMQPGHAIGDGVPARMIARLDALDEAMAARFPGAMAFVRPGLDE
jgi:hypothetical protein